jgi:hypothetical protein
MIDQRQDEQAFVCCACGKRASFTGEDIRQAWSIAHARGWAAAKVDGEWDHWCSKECRSPVGLLDQPARRASRDK